jgi:glycosyltransferase involved in cell wall biosynthesis
MSASSRPVRIGVLATEFFDLGMGRMGGFGFAARQVVEVLHGQGDPPIEVVLLAGAPRSPDGARVHEVHGTRLLYGSGSTTKDAMSIWRERFDAVITIDFAKRYVRTLRALPRTPTVVWARDPRPSSAVAELATLRLPDDSPADGIESEVIADHSIATLLATSARWRRPLTVAGTAPFIVERFEERYGVTLDERVVLPNPITLQRVGPPSERPTVAFLGRLEPVKRPWLVVELARRRPDVCFELMGGSWVSGWEPHDLPDNVQLLGHVDELVKAERLSRAWLLVNTSIHEGLPVSFCEALALGVPLLSTVDADGVASRFGVFTGTAPGDGRTVLPALEVGLDQLVGDHALRRRIAEDATTWAAEHHSRPVFLRTLVSIFERMRATRAARAVGSLLDAD